MNKLLNSPVYAGTVIAITVGGLLSLFLFVKTIGELVSWEDQEVYPSKTITVNGEGEELAVPNIASFSFSVTETAETTQDAQNKATEKINQAISFLKENGVEETDIKTQSYNIYPKYEYRQVVCTAFDCPPSGNREIVGYEISQTLLVKVRQQDEAGRFLTELGRIGISNLSGLSFTIDDENLLYDKAREKAIQDAKQKAERLASELGVKLEGVVSFNEDSPNIYGKGYGSGVMEARDVSMNQAPQLPQGENSYISRVWVTYEIK